MIEMLLEIIIVLAVAAAIVMVLRWFLPQLGVPQPIINAVLLVVAVVVLVWIIRMFLAGSGDGRILHFGMLLPAGRLA
jgi:hypothetical protein